jgi:hypothetical protein
MKWVLFTDKTEGQKTENRKQKTKKSKTKQTHGDKKLAYHARPKNIIIITCRE